MIRRVLALVLAVILAASMLAGCGRQSASKPGAPSALPAKMKVGLVLDAGGRGDLSFNDSAYAGLQKAQEEFGDRIEVKCLEPKPSGEDREALLRALAGEGYDLIFGVGFLFTDHVAKLAKEFPNVKFALIDGFLPDLKKSSNASCLSFMEQEGSFLVGVAAALKSKANKVGFVGGMKIPLVERSEAGFHAGVKITNPKATVLVEYIGTSEDAFRDPTKAKELALKHYDSGADVVYHASRASGNGVFEAAASRKKYAIGADSDQALTARPEQKPLILTSMVKRIDVAVYETITTLLAGKFEGGYRVFGLADGGVGYASNDLNKAFIEEFGRTLEDYKAKVVKGEIVVPMNNEELKTFLTKVGK